MMMWKVMAIVFALLGVGCSTMRAAPLSVLGLSNCEVESIVSGDNYQYLGGKSVGQCEPTGTKVKGLAARNKHRMDSDERGIVIASPSSSYVGFDADERSLRNAHISTRIAAADIRFRTFTDRLMTQKNISALSAAIGAIAFSTASGLTASRGVKDNWAAASALLAGSTSGFDNVAFAKQTVNALVAAMRAKRGQVLTRIFERMQKPLGDYSRLQALHDLEEYEAAGSMSEALDFLSEAARVQETKNVRSMDSLALSTLEQSRIRECLSTSVGQASREQLVVAADRLGVRSSNQDKDDRTAMIDLLIDDVEYTASRDLLQLAVDYADAGLRRCYAAVRTVR